MDSNKSKWDYERTSLINKGTGLDLKVSIDLEADALVYPMPPGDDETHSFFWLFIKLQKRHDDHFICWDDCFP
ncbi:unnamed protein product [Cunninghamella blakesleeana]